VLRATNCIIVEAFFSTPRLLRSQSTEGGRCDAPGPADIDAASLLRSGWSIKFRQSKRHNIITKIISAN
jgi:hypothetical protein